MVLMSGIYVPVCAHGSPRYAHAYVRLFAAVRLNLIANYFSKLRDNEIKRAQYLPFHIHPLFAWED